MVGWVNRSADMDKNNRKAETMWRRRLKFAMLFALSVYLVTYVFLSRRGFVEARQYETEGFYYFTPEDTDRWRFLNSSCRLIFAPLNALDCWIGWGHPAGCDPMFKVSA